MQLTHSHGAKFKSPDCCVSSTCVVAPRLNVGRLKKTVGSTDISNDLEGLLLLDLDNTLTDTRAWYANKILDLTAELASSFAVPTNLINCLLADIAMATTLHEYGFLVEVMASRLRAHRQLSARQISEISSRFWQEFFNHHESIKLYDGIFETIKNIKRRHKNLKIVILTDSPEWIAMERLSLVGLLPLVDGVAAIKTIAPRPGNLSYRECIENAKKRISQRLELVDKAHLKLNISLPANFAKPSHKGIEIVIKKLGLKRGQIIICGDKDTKEGLAAATWRAHRKPHLDGFRNIHFIRADYGNHDIHDPKYRDLAEQIGSLKAPVLQGSFGVPVHRAIDRAEHLLTVVEEIMTDNVLEHVVA